MGKKGAGGEGKGSNRGGKSAFRSGTSSTNPDRLLPSSQKQGFYRSRGTIKLLNLYKSKPEWLRRTGKNGCLKQRIPHPTAPARIEPDRRWFGNVRVVDQNKLSLFREELSKAINDPFSVVLRRSRLPLSLLSGNDGGKTQYSSAGIAACAGMDTEDHEKEEEKEEEDQQPRLSATALLSLEPFANTFGDKSHRKRPLLHAHSLASLALQGERRRERYMHGAKGVAGDGERRDNSNTSSPEATAAGEAVSDDTDRRRQGMDEDDGSTPLPSEEIFKKGTSRRIWGELYKVVDSSDVLVQVLDARDPLGTRCRRLEQYLRKHRQAKHLVFLLNKVDLIPAQVARGWVQLLSKEAPTLLFQAKRQERPAGKLQLFQLLRQYAQLMSDKKHVSVGFIGYPNVGKSSIINALRNKQVCAAAPVPGHVIRGVVRPERIQCPEEHIDELLRRVQPDHLRARYGLPDTCVWSGAEDFLEMLAKKKGRLRKGGEPDISITARIVLYDLQRGRLPYFVPPPYPDGEPRRAASTASAAETADTTATTEATAATGVSPAAGESAAADIEKVTSTAAVTAASEVKAARTGATAVEGTAAAAGVGNQRQRKKRRVEAEAVKSPSTAADEEAATIQIKTKKEGETVNITTEQETESMKIALKKRKRISDKGGKRREAAATAAAISTH